VRQARSAATGVYGLTLRPAHEDELSVCAGIWRTALIDYMSRLNLPAIPDELGPITRLYRHTLGTDPDRFVVALDGDRIVGFISAVVRERLWFLSMLFVEPAAQGAGLGRVLLERVLPSAAEGMTLATGTDSAQPISNALYARYGIVPRMPLLNVTGHPERPDAFGTMPSGIVPVPFEEVAAGSPDGAGHRTLVDAVDALDREVAGFAHPVDHRFLRMESRRGWLYQGPAGEPLGYGYASESGRVGPVAVRDRELLAPILGHLTSAIEPRGAFAIWLPGDADRAVTATLRAGFRLDQFPILLCWSRDLVDFGRYVPISPGLL
jgi:GNAT superfamily N-acetyltransferase